MPRVQAVALSGVGGDRYRPVSTCSITVVALDNAGTWGHGSQMVTGRVSVQVRPEQMHPEQMHAWGRGLIPHPKREELQPELDGNLLLILGPGLRVYIITLS